jgi:SAM-dependent methyltransferase
MTLEAERLRAIVLELLSRPGHEKVRSLIHELLVNGLGASSSEVFLEKRLLQAKGRADALLGRTVFEFKSDLRSEKAAAEEELTRYLADRESAAGERFVGIATDGLTYVPYALREGRLVEFGGFKLARSGIVVPTAVQTASRVEPISFLSWLESVVAIAPQLAPDPETVRRELGRESLAYAVAQSELSLLWAEVVDRPDVQVKRQLWAGLLQKVYGSSVDEDDLFFQHTYLTIVAKTMATRVLGIALPEPDDLLTGRAFHDVGISGAVESDFFDWILSAPEGADLVRRVCHQVVRFRLEDVREDVLKGLYESLIDPEQRHDLGEYYTPDWLAARVCGRAIDRPLEQRVLDPSCGSGTFLFHAVRRILAAAEEAGTPTPDALELCCNQVLGIDVHPVAVLIARVTYLLAIGEARLRRRPALSIPVYLGDSVQWNTQAIMERTEVRIDVPDGPALYFPFTVTADPGAFDAVIDRMLDLSEQGADPDALLAWLGRRGIGDDADRARLVEAYVRLIALRNAGRNHIWGYVARNLSRPIWLSSEGQRVDVIVGNPPWLSYSFMDAGMQNRFRQECEELGVWAGSLGYRQDLSGYFFARCAELYLRHGGTIAMVLPYSALDRRPYEKLRSGSFVNRKQKEPILRAAVRFVEAWAFDEHVQPLFEVPSCVLIATEGETGPFPETVMAYRGALPRRDASEAEAERALSTEERMLGSRAAEPASTYQGRFRQGAIFIPRYLWTVEVVPSGRLGGDPAAPVIESLRSNQEKEPWRRLPGLRGPVEREFLRPMLLGASVAPYRLLSPVTAVVPWDPRTSRLLDSASAQSEGYIDLAKWLADAERVWTKHGKKRRTLLEQLNYYDQLTAQLPPAAVRVVYAASGAQPAVAVLEDPAAVVEHGLYWAAAGRDEAHYLAAILNSETARARVAHLQDRGQWGARHFDKIMLDVLPIPPFDPESEAHRELVSASVAAEGVAQAAELPPGGHFTRARQLIRKTLTEAGIDETVNALVARLLDG